VFAPLLTSPPTLIHGEFYAKTVLVRRGKLFMVDWESAAIGPGEVDLAALTEGKHWRGDVARQANAAIEKAAGRRERRASSRRASTQRAFTCTSAGWASAPTGPPRKDSLALRASVQNSQALRTIVVLSCALVCS